MFLQLDTYDSLVSLVKMTASQTRGIFRVRLCMRTSRKRPLKREQDKPYKYNHNTSKHHTTIYSRSAHVTIISNGFSFIIFPFTFQIRQTPMSAVFYCHADHRSEIWKKRRKKWKNNKNRFFVFGKHDKPCCTYNRHTPYNAPASVPPTPYWWNRSSLLKFPLRQTLFLCVFCIHKEPRGMSGLIVTA